MEIKALYSIEPLTKGKLLTGFTKLTFCGLFLFRNYDLVGILLYSPGFELLLWHYVCAIQHCNQGIWWICAPVLQSAINIGKNETNEAVVPKSLVQHKTILSNYIKSNNCTERYHVHLQSLILVLPGKHIKKLNKNLCVSLKKKTTRIFKKRITLYQWFTSLICHLYTTVHECLQKNAKCSSVLAGNWRHSSFRGKSTNQRKLL